MAQKTSTTDLIVQLQNRLIRLGENLNELPPKEIEAAAKAINALMVSLEKADAYLSRHSPPSAGGGLSKVSRLDLLRKIKRMVDNGVLRELDDV